MEDYQTTWFRCMTEPNKKKLIEWMEKTLRRKVLFYRAFDASPGPGGHPRWTVEVTWRSLDVPKNAWLSAIP